MMGINVASTDTYLPYSSEGHLPVYIARAIFSGRTCISLGADWTKDKIFSVSSRHGGFAVFYSLLIQLPMVGISWRRPSGRPCDTSQWRSVVVLVQIDLVGRDRVAIFGHLGMARICT